MMVLEIAPPRRWRLARTMAGMAAAWLLACTSTAWSQQEPPPDETKGQEAKADPPSSSTEKEAAQKAEEAAQKAEDEAREQSVLEDSIFVDPRAEQAMQNTFEELHRRAPQGQTAPALVRMAKGEMRPDPAMIERHVKAAAKELTDHANIDAVLKSSGDGPDSRRVKNIEEAGKGLLEPLKLPVDQRNAAFTREYSARLLEVAPELMKNHLLARVQIMLALSRLGDRSALPFLMQVLADPEQPVVLKELAAQGINTIAVVPNRSLTVNETVTSAEALTGFLKSEPDFWPARVRALEALGNLRQISTVMQRDLAVMAQVALEVLANPDERLEVRAKAAWALGMLEVPAGYPQVNYSLMAFHTGQLAAQIGSEILESKPERVKALTAILAFPIYGALNGSGPRGSGIVRSQSLGPHQSYVNQMTTLVKQLATDCIALTRAAGSQATPARDAVASRVAELKTFLQKSQPPSDALVPGAPALAEKPAPAAAPPSTETAPAESGAPPSR